MINSKRQTPSFKEAPSFKRQDCGRTALQVRVLDLELEGCFVFDVWCLEFET